ncbi:MAG: MOSC domain-containing protein [Methylobacter sp.]|nr:MAG: MOSC domain-containing protein [Methylobacter sp.]PPD37565.1 MAG: MOSC domain-containing protein [Methylomonas sp.]
MTSNNQPEIKEYTVSTIWRYPVKSMQGEELNGSHVGLTGVLGDRAYALIDRDTGKVVSAKNPKKWPGFFDFRARYINPELAANPEPVWITLPDGSLVRSDHTEINAKISQFLGQKVELKSQAPNQAQLEQFWPEYAGQANEISNEAVAGDAAEGTFFDYATIHILTTSSLEALQECYPTGRFEARRFRPNIIINSAGVKGFVENAWVGKTIRIGNELRLQITDPCPRCIMPTLAQGDLPADNGIFKDAIAKNRPLVPFANKELPSVGVYARVLQPGWLKRNDNVMIED